MQWGIVNILVRRAQISCDPEYLEEEIIYHTLRGSEYANKNIEQASKVKKKKNISQKPIYFIWKNVLAR